MRDALPEARRRPRLTVIGVGNAWRGDDAAGLIAARRIGEIAADDVEVHEREGDYAGLVELFARAPRAVVVDACTSGAAPGALRVFEASAGALPERLLRSSTHALGVADAVELARALGRLPERLEVYAIEGADFALGAGLSRPVAEAVERLVAMDVWTPSLAPPRTSQS